MSLVRLLRKVSYAVCPSLNHTYMVGILYIYYGIYSDDIK